MDILSELGRQHSQINRVFRDVILASPLIQHKIELYAAGLEYNATAGTSLTDSKGAFARYRSNLGSLCPVEKGAVEILKTRLADHAKSGGGVFMIVKDSVRVFTLDSPSRGIPHSEWEILLPVIDPADYCFYPGDNVIAFIKQQGAVCVCFSYKWTSQTHSSTVAIHRLESICGPCRMVEVILTHCVQRSTTHKEVLTRMVSPLYRSRAPDLLYSQLSNLA